MENSKLTSLLRTFSAAEMDRFVKFAHADYHNTNAEILQLLLYLQEQYPDFEASRMEKEVLFNAVFKEAKYDKKQLSYQMNYLLNLAARFLSIEELEKKQELRDCLILNAFVKRNLDKHYNHQYKNLEKTLNTACLDESDAFYYRYLMSDIAVDHFGRRQIRKYDENLQLASNALDDFYFLHKLKYSCEMLNRQAILSDQFSIPFLEEVENYLAKQENLEPLIAIYLQIYFSLLHPEEEQHFKLVTQLINAHGASIKKEELRSIYLYAINICARKIRQGKSAYMNIALDLYEEGIKNKSLYDNNYLSHWTYNNVLKLAIRLQRFEWFESFIYTYNRALKPEFQADALQYNLAEYYYQKKDLEQALIHLNKVNFKDINYLLGSRILLIKTFYESDAMDAALSALASFKIYLRRNKQIAASIKKSCLNFCDLLYKITKIHQPNKEELKEKIASTQPLTERAWLLKAFELQHQ